MRLASFSTLLVAVLISSPALYHAFVIKDMDPKTAGIRFLIAVPVAGIMMAVLRSLGSAYQASARRSGRPIRVTAVTGEPLPMDSPPLPRSERTEPQSR